MNKLIFIIFIITSTTFSQKKEASIFYRDFVECFYEQETTELLSIYDKIDGKIVAQLSNSDEIFCWYKLTLLKSKNGWFEIENLMIVPDCSSHEVNKDINKYKGCWIKKDNLRIEISEIAIEGSKGIKFYSEPSIQSNLVYRSPVYLKTELIEIKDLWAKVRFKLNNKVIEGWLHDDDQCAYPWTTCTSARID